MTTDEAVAVLTDPDAGPEDRYRAHADLHALAASGDGAAGAALAWLRLERSGRNACEAP
ncbi:hypothetical protein [Saccharothrix violaceirubra]|uniref:Uncharacterized protein n=1 Tax=Saccharothrix violaceirubra TaxID=413306 RepID=A0A7W7T2S8_9PSEU|nr:hypothetical protein [Saccharothrix violaceirubra]MBB4964932.1 hypothetical protein [Saccharothrix violaceirubra]